MAHLNRILWLCCTLLLVAINAFGQSAYSDWPRYTVAGEEFSITLPAVPAMTTYVHTMYPIGKLRTQRHLGVYAEGVVFTIFCDDDDPQDGLKNSRKRLQPSLGWEVSSEQAVNRDGVTGKQYTSSHPLGGVLQVFATKKHFYRIQAFGAPAADPRVQHFFSSLTLKKNPDGIKLKDGPGTPFDPASVSGPPPNDVVLLGNQVARKVVLLMKPEPSYTEQARQHQVTGTVVLKAVFAANGVVANIRVVSGLRDGLTEQCIAFARRIKFIPAAKDGKFVSMWMQLEYNFNLY